MQSKNITLSLIKPLLIYLLIFLMSKNALAKINLNDLQPVKNNNQILLGQGSFAKVFLARHKKTGEFYAIK